MTLLRRLRLYWQGTLGVAIGAGAATQHSHGQSAKLPDLHQLNFCCRGAQRVRQDGQASDPDRR